MDGMTVLQPSAVSAPGLRQPSTPPLALLLDVDGPVASPVTRDVKPEIIDDLVALAAAGIPVIFNTGRSDAFIREQVMEPMIEAGIPSGTVIHAVCEKGAVWFSYTAAGPGPIHVDHELAVPAAYGDDIRRLVAEDYAAHMFFDETKRAMVSVEQHINVPSADYLAEQKLFDADAMELMARHGLGVVRMDHHVPDSDDEVDYRVDPTIISTDIESVRLGKDLGASRAVELLAAQGITPQAWRTVGDSRTDYAMADWLHHNDHAVKHVDVRPADGVPAKPYDVLTAADLGLAATIIHDDAGGAFLRSWREALGV
jgi:hydroxymethylpyrimidine pyrophosphatase-like HAD family hydrolase